MNVFEFIDNKDGTITKKIGGNEYVYNILVGDNIPDNESIIDYCYYQHESTLVTELIKSGVGDWSFCSGTCVAMILAIANGNSNIVPKDVLYWENNLDAEGNPEINWTWTTDDKGNTTDNGLKDWEIYKDINGDGGQIYDNRYYDYDKDEFCYKSFENDITDETSYLEVIKANLTVGNPIIIHVTGHFVVVVGVEAGVKLEDATLGQLVIFDPATIQDKKITTLSDSYGNYGIADYRIITPYIIDENGEFILDENGNKTANPKYAQIISSDSVDNDESLEAIFARIDDTDMPDSEKKRIKEIIKRDIEHQTGKTLDKGKQTINSITNIFKSFTTASKTKYDPLILDIDGDGYNVETKENGANFDLDKNGFAEKINWTKKDGFLCLDLNGNGTIDNGGELFGDKTA